MDKIIGFFQKLLVADKHKGSFLVISFLSLLIACSFQPYVFSGSNTTLTLNNEDGINAGIEIKIPVGRKYDYNNIKCTKVVDGDTIILENGERVRLIGIDTPEAYESDKLYRDSSYSGQDASAIQAMGKRSSQFTQELVLNRRVKLEFDVEKRDKYGRLLAYVFIIFEKSDKIEDILPKDGFYYSHLTDKLYVFLNASIIRSGYAGLMSIPPNIKYSQTFRELYQEAQKDSRGLFRQTRPNNQFFGF